LREIVEDRLSKVKFMAKLIQYDLVFGITELDALKILSEGLLTLSTVSKLPNQKKQTKKKMKKKNITNPKTNDD